MKIAVIPARGGSKRIPRKNIRSFCGKPIIAYSIEAAQASGLFDEIIVSTDDAEIAEVARQFGATAPFVRPTEISDDHTGTAAVVKHAVTWFIERGDDITHVCCIYATAPLIEARFLREAHDALTSSDAAFAFSVTSYAFPIQRALRMTPAGRVDPFHPEHRLTRSQDLAPAYHDAGQFYWGTAAAFLEDVPIFSERSVGVVLPRHLVQDIDTVEDWEQAEYMFRAVNRG
ncbi:N-acylneuraminate cytidylyltransferase [Bradyrhizobium japonicum USDA 38]|uniref:pseudaminic acid cytidylyltransferase n=1 Tax=Bradyrhizobium japonicum TaxID=375 RepID=UPI00041AF4A0|nr:pseudaminic acid cytidylyltransferase [Bradyrhizobium japonicum]MCS3894574.1 N-acylneuraminate cytidylyltransferase [Bradyrhizobium japonicum USDA 38]MCS3947088.1 N-acylneuraminate cytidylyltransferase [Bradyrhizobium japonicum]MCW2220081.1 N-acylneuraminate cytidylyltransferase [Bradyrhizobium japonicum]MCW2344695.1 N-acylneuraminate cytidylyltransferase [Bradyrhizobium japonicum]